jgi:hypothetical protein
MLYENMNFYTASSSLPNSGWGLDRKRRINTVQVAITVSGTKIMIKMLIA